MSNTDNSIAIVKELVEAHGGRINVANNAEGGASVQILFPS